VAEKGERQAALLQASAEAMLAIAREPGTNGLGNFRFCASFCVRPGVPFFPAAYHDQVREWSGVWEEGGVSGLSGCKANVFLSHIHRGPFFL
jgi:hypothetical protein